MRLEEIPILFNENLYDFSGNQLIEVIKEISNNINKVMIFAHNNAVTYFVNQYSNARIDNVPTCGFSHIKFEIENWKQLQKGKLIDFKYPKELR